MENNMHPTTKFLRDIVFLWKDRSRSMVSNDCDIILGKQFIHRKREDCIKAIALISESFIDEFLSEEEARDFVNNYWTVKNP
jgi:hypothetical protein